MSLAETTISIQGLVKEWKGSDRSFLLEVPQFHVPPGELVAVIGESGCGKSTLLDILGLVQSPTKVESYRVWDPHRNQTRSIATDRVEQLTSLRRSNYGYVLQQGGLLNFVTVRENIKLPTRITRKGLSNAQIDRLCKDLKINHLMKRRPLMLSGGERQRVAVARALAHKPNTVLADEPTAALDPPLARQLLGILVDYSRKIGAGLVVVTHNYNLIRDVATELAMPTTLYTFHTAWNESRSETHSICREHQPQGGQT